MKQYILEKLFKVFEWFVLLVLLISAGLFVKDVWNNYKSEVTSINVSTKILDSIDFPTLTVCFQPIGKLSVLKQNNITLMEFNLGQCCQILRFFHS